MADVESGAGQSGAGLSGPTDDIPAHELLVSVVSADQEVWSGLARQVIARTTIGEIGILAGHEPVLATLAAYFAVTAPLMVWFFAPSAV